MTERFAHHLRLKDIHDGQRLDLTADEDEREAIAQRLGIEALSCLEAHAALSRNGDVVRAEGRLAASLHQRCVVTSDPIAAHVDEHFEVMFKPAPTDGADEELELGGDDLDVVFHDGVIDLGTAIADTLALSLDPFPRSAAADAALKEAGVLTEAEASPFAALAQLKKSSENS